MNGMDKMWASFVAIGLMAVASFLISFARAKTKGVVKLILSIVAFAMLLIGLPYMIVSML